MTPDTVTHLVFGFWHAWTWGRVVALGAGVAAVMLASAAARTAVGGWRHRRWSRHAQQILVHPPPEVDPAGAAACWANLAGLLAPARRRRLLYGTPHLAWEYRWAGRRLQILVWVPGTVPAGSVAAALRAAWPGASTVIQPATPPVPAVPGVAAGGALAPARPAWFPIATDHPADPTRALIAAGASLRGTENACVQVLARPAAPRPVRRLRAGAAATRTGRRPATVTSAIEGLALALVRIPVEVASDLLAPTQPRTAQPRAAGTRAAVDPVRDADARPGLDKALAPQWEVAIRYTVTHPATDTGRHGDSHPQQRDEETTTRRRRLAMLAHALAAAFAVHTGRNRFRPVRVRRPAHVIGARVLRAGFLLSTSELAVLATLPTDVAVPGLDRARARAVPAPIAVPTGGRGTKVLGRAQAGGHAVALPVADARQHVHVLGSTGSGKSILMSHLILDDIRNRRGVVLIDPKGDLALDILDRLPDGAADRLVLIDPDQPSGGATFNPLQRQRGGVDDDVVVDNIVAIFAAIFARHWGPRIDDVLRVACLTVMRHPNPSLVTIAPLLTDKQFRAPFTTGLDDPEGLLGFWQWYEATPAHLRSQVIGPVLARLRSFLLRDFVRATIGPPASSFDMRKVLDGGILIARLPKGQLGEDASRLLGSLILASVWQAATARARQPEHRRRDATVVIDEAHNVLNLAGSVADMLAEARGYRLGLVLAHQNLTQLPRDTQLALSANARNKIYFTCSPEDARPLARHTLPELDEHDLSHLDAYTAGARLVVANRETAAFTLTTNPPRPAVEHLDLVRAAVSEAVHAAAGRRADPAPSPDRAPEPATSPPPAPAPAAAASTDGRTRRSDRTA